MSSTTSSFPIPAISISCTISTNHFTWAGNIGVCSSPVVNLQEQRFFAGGSLSLDVQSTQSGKVFRFDLVRRYLFWLYYESPGGHFKIWMNSGHPEGVPTDLTLHLCPINLKGVSFALTGAVPDITREEVIDTILQKGGVYHGKVTSKTDYLVVSPGFGGTKISDAVKHKTKILDGQQFQHFVFENCSS